MIIENKRTDAVSVRDKEEAWLKILDEYNQQSNCRPRELGNIKTSGSMLRRTPRSCMKKIKGKHILQVIQLTFNYLGAFDHEQEFIFITYIC